MKSFHVSRSMLKIRPWSTALFNAIILLGPFSGNPAPVFLDVGNFLFQRTTEAWFYPLSKP